MNNGVDPASRGVAMAALPCKCILALNLSSLRKEFDTTCRFLDDNGWATLCRYLASLGMLNAPDLEAISYASKIRNLSQTREMILRLERNANLPVRFTIDELLYQISSTLGIAQYSCVLSLLRCLHTPDCSVTVESARNMPPSTTRYNYPVQNTPMPPGTQNHPRLGNPSGFQMDSINNLSHPNRPYLYITRHPTDATVAAGDNLILRCLAETDETPLTYSWFKDGLIVPDCNNKILIIPDTQPGDNGDYFCVVSNRTLKVESKTARVVINAEPNQTPDPSPQNDVPHSLHFATDKYALLVANEQYAHNPILTSATNDVRALASLLRDQLKFKTVSLVNLNLNEMNKAVEVFRQYLIDGAYCVTYLAGHGFENDGHCYIVPTDAPRDYGPRDCFSVKKMIEGIRSTCNLGLTVVLLDVCRKRNRNAVCLAEPKDPAKKYGNFVISFATMEHGMAYEVRGRDLGVYVSSLINHLSKDKRVTRVLELVHKEIHRNSYTNGIQQPEFKSNIFEDRKLTDPVKSNLSVSQQEQINREWNAAHVGSKPTLFIFESCGAKIELHKASLFSNVLSLETKLIDKGAASSCGASVALTNQRSEGAGCRDSTATRIDVVNLQRLSAVNLPITVFLNSLTGSDVRDEKWDDNISVPFISWWSR